MKEVSEEEESGGESGSGGEGEKEISGTGTGTGTGTGESESESESGGESGSEERGPVPYAIAGGVTAAVAGAFVVALAPERAGTSMPFAVLAGVYGVFAAVAVLRMRARGELWLLKPKSGDLTFGAMVAILLYGLSFVVHSLFTSAGEPHHAWIARVYLVLGDPFSSDLHMVAAGITMIGIAEELTWRGWVLPMLEERIGVFRASAATTVLWAVAHLPTMWLLSDPVVGLNPLLVTGTLGCGAAWSYLRWRMVRLVPVLISHGLFTWFVVEFPLWLMGR